MKFNMDKEGAVTLGLSGTSLAQRALIFATAAHAAIGQKRKYTGEEYIEHPKEVGEILKRNIRHLTSEMLAAAYLHDVIEGTQITEAVIRKEFGDTVANYVIGLTHKSKPEDGSRAVRKEIDKNFLAEQCAEVQTIKVADLIHNTESIVEHDKNFARVYLAEKFALLKVLTKAHKGLLAFANVQTMNSLNRLDAT